MNIILDVDYNRDYPVVGGVFFKSFTDCTTGPTLRAVYTGKLEKYIPGEFFKRELPCLLYTLDEIAKDVEIIVIDGYCNISGKPALGDRLSEALDGKPVIGIAKNKFEGNTTEKAVLRGNSKKPVYVSTSNYPLEKAAKLVENMQGIGRLPTLVKQADKVARQ